MIEVFAGVHISIIFVHPLGVIEVCHVFLQVVHGLCDVFALGVDRHCILLIEVMVFLMVSMCTGAELGQRVVLDLFFSLASAVVHVVQPVRAVVVGRCFHLFKLYAILCN